MEKLVKGSMMVDKQAKTCLKYINIIPSSK